MPRLMPSRRAGLAVLAIVALAVGAAVVVRTASEQRPLLRRAQIGPPLLRLIRVGSFDEPVYVTAAPGDRRRLFVVERTGRIHVVRDGRRLATPFLDLSRVANHSGFENGLLSIAFAPDYARTGRFYVDYTGKDNAVRVVEYRRSTPDRADPATRRQILLVRKAYAGEPKKQRKRGVDTHNGGLVLFGPDRRLYVGVGDGGESYDPHNHSQDLGVLLGKILRIDPRPSPARPYRIPPDNPFVRRPGARPEIYAYGLRNPWRFAFSRDGGMAIADVGEDWEEEIDFAPPRRTGGHNYGWRVFEGFHKTGIPRAYRKSERAASGGTAPGAISPAFAYKHLAICGPQWKSHAPRPPRCGPCSITGGVFVRDPMLRGYGGRYVYGDYCTGRVYSLVLGSGRARFGAPALARPVPLISSFGEDAAGHVYVSSQSGAVYRLAPPVGLRPRFAGS
jgi:glucose/arabinose dehydrogenase